MAIIKTFVDLPRDFSFQSTAEIGETVRDIIRFLDALPKFEILDAEHYLEASTNTKITLNTNIQKVYGLLQIQLYRSKEPATVLDTGIRVALPHWRWGTNGLEIHTKEALVPMDYIKLFFWL